MNGLQEGIIFLDDPIKEYKYETKRNTIITLQTADLHFAAFDPKEQFELLNKYQLNYAEQLPKLDIFSINGDIFHHKVTTTSDAALYANIYMERLVRICKEKNTTLVIIHGTYKHDAGQLNLFMQYINDPEIDIRIVNEIRFEYIKGARILCIPELYGVDESIYNQYLFRSGFYDMCFMHGTIKGAIYGDTVGNGKLFTIEDFCKCRGPIFSGHVHTSACYNKYFYYTGSPYRWQFGEEEPKGFLIGLMNLETGSHLVEFQEILGPTYITIKFDDIVEADPQELIQEINRIKTEQKIDFIRVQFNDSMIGSTKTIINNYYRENKNVKIEYTESKIKLSKSKDNKELTEDDQFSFILDDKLSDEEKFVRYVNEMKGFKFITVDRLLEILKEEV